MRRFAVLGVTGVVLVGGAVFAATGFGGSDEKVTVGPPVAKEIKRVSQAQARANGASARLPGARGKKPRLSYFVATTPTNVPANTATALTTLTCPSGQKVVSGFFETDRLITVDDFRAVAPNAWQFGFVDLSGVPGAALEGVVCAKGVK